MFGNLTDENVNILSYVLSLWSKKKQKKERERMKLKEVRKQPKSSYAKSNDLLSTQKYIFRVVFIFSHAPL